MTATGVRRALVSTGLGLVVALAAAPGSGARSTSVVQLNLGDGFLIENTHVVCLFATGSHLLSGKRAVGCSLVKGDRLALGSYASALAVDGQAILARIRPDGTARTVISRKPAVAGAAPQVYKLAKGDVAHIRGTRMFCFVSVIAVPTALCARYDASGKRYVPGSYEISLSDKVASLGRFDARGKNVRLVKQVAQPPL